MRTAVRRRTFLATASKAALGASYLAAGGCTQPGAPPPAVSVAPEPLIADLEQHVPRWMDEATLPGLAIGLIRDARLIWQRGFGVADRSSGAAIDDDTIFEVGSMSKPVFAYVVIKLHEDGVLDLDAPLVTYMPGRFVDQDARSEFITARHVLSHTSGLPSWRSGDTPLTLQFTPGEEWLYSGEAYYYLQSVVTHLTGRVTPNLCGRYEADLSVCASDIDSFMKARLLVPFGMTSSGYVWTDTFAARSARPHDTRGVPMVKAQPNAADAARYASAGGLHATLADYARFVIEVIDPKPADAVRLRRDSIDMMVRPIVPLSQEAPRSSWALGWQVLHTTSGNVIAHGGDNPGFHAFAAASRDRRAGFVVVTNGDGGTRVIERLLFTADTLSRLVAGA